jgi:Glycosyltransferase
MPSTTLSIVGKEPSAKVRALAQNDPSITVTGFVEDVRPFIAKAGVYIVPLRIGAGTRLKILEALSMKKAVVSTSVGCEGLDVTDGEHLLIRDTPSEFANAVIALMKDEKRCRDLGENGHKLIKESYDWNAVFKDLDPILKEVKCK